MRFPYPSREPTPSEYAVGCVHRCGFYHCGSGCSGDGLARTSRKAWRGSGVGTSRIVLRATPLPWVGEVVKVANVVLGLRMYVFCIITAFRVALSGVAIQPNMTSECGFGASVS